MTFTRSHAPLGYDRLYSLFLDSFYSTTPIYRHIPNFLAQFGISTSSKLNEKWGWPNTIPDDPWVPGFHRFTRGSISFAGSGPDSRTTDIFICLMETGGSLGANKGNSPWEVPVGRVIEGMNVVERFYSGYGDVDAFNPGKGISQQKLRNRGEEYVNADFPLISRFTTCEIEVVDGNLFGDRAKTENSKRKQEMIEREKNRDVDKGGRFNKWDVEKLSKNARMKGQGQSQGQDEGWGGLDSTQVRFVWGCGAIFFVFLFVRLVWGKGGERMTKTTNKKNSNFFFPEGKEI